MRLDLIMTHPQSSSALSFSSSSSSASSPSSPSPSVPATGGTSSHHSLVTPQNALDAGKAGEHLVCADLLLSGIQAYLSDQGLRYDVVADVDGRLVRVQVKSTGRARKENGRRLLGYRFEPRARGVNRRERLRDVDCDIVAFVALDIRIIAYLPVFEVGQACDFYPPDHDFAGRYKRLRQQPIDAFPFASAYERFLVGPGGRRAGGPLAPADVPLEVDGITKTMAEWADDVGISVSTLEARLRSWDPREAVASGPGRPGENPQRMIEFGGERRTLTGWAKHMGLTQACLWGRIVVRKWPLERALTTPARRSSGRV